MPWMVSAAVAEPEKLEPEPVAPSARGMPARRQWYASGAVPEAAMVNVML
jgi:hypothetical protein